MCVCAEGGGKSVGKFRFFKPMNPIIRSLIAHFFVQNTFSLMKCLKSNWRSKKKMLCSEECCKAQLKLLVDKTPAK